jgi:predicted butyrate kinase (DUF1464 family)
MPEDPVVY